MFFAKGWSGVGNIRPRVLYLFEWGFVGFNGGLLKAVGQGIFEGCGLSERSNGRSAR